jgi:hypothetical protein
MANVKLLKKVLRRIHKDEKHFKQGDWVSIKGLNSWSEEPFDINNLCGTSYCFAGHAAIMTGYPDFNSFLRGYLVAAGGADTLSQRNVSGVMANWISVKTHLGYGLVDHAEKALGLTRDQADRLFEGGNSLTRIDDLVRSFIEIEEAKVISE